MLNPSNSRKKCVFYFLYSNLLCVLWFYVIWYFEFSKLQWIRGLMLFGSFVEWEVEDFEFTRAEIYRGVTSKLKFETIHYYSSSYNVI